MEMGAGGCAGVAHGADTLAGLDKFPFPHCDAIEVDHDAEYALAVVNADGVAMDPETIGFAINEANIARCGGNHGCAGAGGIVYAAMVVILSKNAVIVPPDAVGGGDAAIGGAKEGASPMFFGGNKIFKGGNALEFVGGCAIAAAPDGDPLGGKAAVFEGNRQGLGFAIPLDLEGDGAGAIEGGGGEEGAVTARLEGKGGEGCAVVGDGGGLVGVVDLDENGDGFPQFGAVGVDLDFEGDRRGDRPQ